MKYSEKDLRKILRQDIQISQETENAAPAHLSPL